MDTTDSEITFNNDGYCNHCSYTIEYKKIHGLNPSQKQNEFNKKIQYLKSKGQGKKYDCIIGVSGGVDSTYLAYLVKEAGLRPLAIHLDNGWNSELAVSNIKKVLNHLNIELYTHVLDWNEFKNLQLAFLKASTPDSEIPTDHAILALLRKIAVQEKVPIVLGTNISSESILPPSWSQGYSDWGYIKKINEKFGQGKLKDFPHTSVLKFVYYERFKRLKIISLLDLIDYDKEQAKQFLIDKLGWVDYGGKHYESIYTRFFQGYILPEKFGFDKRKAHLSSLIMAGQITRDEALIELKKEAYPKDLVEKDKAYVIKKLGITEHEFEEIINTLPKKYLDFSPKLPRKFRELERIFFKKIILIKNRIK